MIAGCLYFSRDERGNIRMSVVKDGREIACAVLTRVEALAIADTLIAGATPDDFREGLGLQ